MNHILEKLRKQLPWLKQVPDSIYWQLDEHAFVIPSEKIIQDAQHLERIFDHHVMTYDKKYFDISVPIETHLCAWIQKANLNEQQLKILDSFEKKNEKYGVNFVVYQKPLLFIQPSRSPIGRFYHTFTDQLQNVT